MGLSSYHGSAVVPSGPARLIHARDDGTTNRALGSALPHLSLGSSLVRIRMGKTVGFAWTWGAVLFLACKPHTKIAPEKVTIRYCTSSVQVRDIEHCVAELTPAQQRRRHVTTRLTYRNDRLVRREYVSGSGLPIDDDIEDYEYLKGRIAVVVHRSRNGVPRGRETFSVDGLVSHNFDALGRPKPYNHPPVPSLKRRFDAAGLVLSTSYLDVAGTPTPVDGIYEERVKRNAQGVPTEHAYFGRNGEPVTGPQEAHRQALEVDTQGWMRARSCFGHQGQSTRCWGPGNTRFQYDNVGNMTEMSFFGADDRPVCATDSGAVTVRFTRDERGNLLESRHFDEQGKPALGADQYAAAIMRYDAQDRQIEVAYFGVDGSAIKVTDEGASIVRSTYDVRSNLTERRYLDQDGARTLNRDGFFRVDIEYDARDNPTTYRYRDLAERPVKIARGFATKKFSYDGDRLISYALFGVADQPTLGRDDYARAEATYNANGKPEWRYFDVEGKDVVRTHDCHGSVP